jgi:hypothetical protein
MLVISGLALRVVLPRYSRCGSIGKWVGLIKAALVLAPSSPPLARRVTSLEKGFERVDRVGRVALFEFKLIALRVG